MENITERSLTIKITGKNVFICILKVELKLLIRFRNTGLVNPTYKPILLQKLDLPDQYYEIVVLTFSCNRECPDACKHDFII